MQQQRKVPVFYASSRGGRALIALMFEFLFGETVPSGVVARLGNYDCLAVIGEGSIGVVFEAVDRTRPDQPPVALKRLKNAFYTGILFKEKMAMVQTDGHPGWVKYVDYLPESPERSECLVMELCTGGSLGAEIRHRAPRSHRGQRLNFEKSEVLLIFLQISLALCHLHNTNFVHRDIKPDNVLFDECGCVVIGGLSSALDSNFSGCAHDGTPLFWPPEAFETESKPRDRTSPAWDVWSLALTILAMFDLSSDGPYSNMTSFDELKMHVQAGPLPCITVATKDNVDSWLDDILKQMLLRERVNRINSVSLARRLLSSRHVSISAYLSKLQDDKARRIVRAQVDCILMETSSTSSSFAT